PILDHVVDRLWQAAKDRSRAWAGRIADSFCIDLSLLAIINGAVATGTAPDLAKRQPEHAANSFVARQTSGTPAKLCRESRLAVTSGTMPESGSNRYTPSGERLPRCNKPVHDTYVAATAVRSACATSSLQMSL